MANNTVEIDRSYVDNYGTKEFIINTLVPKYFPDIDVSLRSIGMLGLTSELITNISEDGFNAASVLFREAFPNRAEIPESIYSHASIFQLSNIFSKASSCSFLIVIEEKSIIDNMVYDPMSSMYNFYLDKNTTIYVEDIPYVLDYDVKIRCVKKKTSNTERYMFTASYILDDYTNSISNITDPYIKIRRSSDGYIAIEVKMHQVTRDIQFEQIVTNSKINMPSVDISFDGQLVGFDVLYKTAEESTYNTQMQKLLVYSQPITSPFCYYQLYNDNTLRLTFNAKDSYFTPKFNSELKVILYLSKGKEANFDAYTGSNIVIEPDTSVYNYDTTIVMAAKPLTGSLGGDDRLGLDELKSLTIEGYRTALALTTEADLTSFFSNYKYNYGDFAIQFIKRRNDVYERIFGGYCLMQYESEIFKTNTLDIHMNLSDMKNPETNIYMIEPGTLFTYANDKDIHVTFYRDSEKYNQYYSEYEEAIKNNEIPFIINADETVPGYLKTRNASFAEFKSRKGYDDTVHVFDLTDEQVTELDNPLNSKFMFINPFLIRFKKSPNLVSLYQTYINKKSTLDFTNQNDDSFVQFISYQVQIQRQFDVNKEYTITTAVMPSISLDKEYPVIARYGTDADGNVIYNLNNKYTLDQNDLRVLFVIYDNGTPICYSEMYPTTFNNDTNLIYETKFSSDDHITSENKLRLRDDTIYRVVDAESILAEYPDITDIQNGYYFKVNKDTNTFYTLYDQNDNVIQENISVDNITVIISSNYVKKYSKLVSMYNIGGDILIPMENVECKVFTLYRRKYQETEKESAMVLTTHDDTNNIFVRYDGTAENDYADSTYDSYIWTNEYTTGLDPLTFIKSLIHVRSNLYFEDYTELNTDGSFKHDIMDVRMESLPFIRWNLAFDNNSMSKFMDTFTAQYDSINSIISERLRNETSIDVKFYNTYGRSKNYYIGNNEELLNALNLRIEFDMWFVIGTDTLAVIPEIKSFIKEQIETISDNGTNHIHISNLMRSIEHTFSYVDHIVFKGFNDYETDHQSIKLIYNNIDNMSKELRRKYVPELLVIDLDDIIINEYESMY